MRGDLHGLGFENEAHVIEEMAGFADDASAAFGDIGIPVGRIEFAGHAAVGHRHGAGCACKNLLQFPAGGRETAVEADLDGGVARFVSAIDFAQFVAVEAERFFDEDLAFRFERGENERRVQMMARADDDGAVCVFGKSGVGVGVGALKAEFRFDVIRAECGLVDHRAEGNLAFEVRQEHGAREIAGADDIDVRNRGGELLRFRLRRF